MARKPGGSVPKKLATGRKVSWQWGGKTKTGKLIPSYETKDYRYARTQNGKLKRLKK